MQDRTTKDPTAKDQDRDPEEIRRDIRHTRGEMDRTVDELVDRFSVGNLVDEAWQRMRRTGGGGSDVGEMLREHPVPIALVGLGLGWLAVEQASGRSVSTDTFGSGSQTGGNGGVTAQSGGNRVREAGGNRLSDRESHTSQESHTGGNGAANGDGMMDEVSEHASGAMDTAREKLSDMKDSTKAAGSRTRAGFQDFLAESPLTVGSIVFGLGLASGLALPSSDLEDREVGELADQIKSKASSLGKEAADRAGEVGHEVADTALAETRSQVDDLRNGSTGNEMADRPSPI